MTDNEKQADRITSLQREVIRIAAVNDIVCAAFQMHTDEKEALRQAVVDLHKYNKVLEQSRDRIGDALDEVLHDTRQLRHK